MSMNISQQVELTFWRIAIPVLSRNKTIRQVVRTVVSISNSPEQKAMVLYVIGGCFAGLTSGILIYWLSSAI